MPEVSPIPKVFAPRKARKRLAPVSPKRLSEKERRDEVRQIVLAAAGHHCQGPAAGLPGRCGWIGDRRELEVHEARQRSTHPGSHLDPTDAYALCPQHHEAVTSPSGEARQVALATGLLITAGAVARLSCEEDHR